MKDFILCLLCLATAGCGWDEATARADKPVSREAASQDLNFPFPISATNIYYVVHSGGMQEFQLFVRFMVSPGDETNAVNEILANENNTVQEHDSFPAVPPVNEFSAAVPSLSPMPWWKPDSMTNGYCRASTNGDPFCIWANLTEHTIYVHASD